MPPSFQTQRSQRMVLHRAIPRGVVAGLFALLAFACMLPSPARADDDLAPRVGRVADVGGELFLAPQDAPEQWVAIGINYPVASGDNIWVSNDGRAEIDFGLGQFRLAANTSLHLSRLDDANFALYVAQGQVILRVRVLELGETARIDTPNSQIALTRPGLYRIEVSEDRQHTQVAVREGEAVVDTGTVAQQILPGQSATLDGDAPASAQLRNGVTTDGFDTWSANRDRRYDRNRVNAPVSRQMVGSSDLDDYGAWDTAPEYGAVWYPANVAEDWAPYRNGYWTEVAVWGPTWVDAAPWGYAPFHYGRWVHIRGRWGWCPGGYVAKPVWAPALVGWVGGPGWRVAGRSGTPIYGWVPLGWGEAYHPRWKGCSDACWARYNKPYAVNTAVRRNANPDRYANSSAPGGLTAVPAPALAGRRPIAANLVPVSAGAVANAPALDTPPVRPEIRQSPGIRPGNGIPIPASAAYAPAMRTPRTASQSGTTPIQGLSVPVPRAAPPEPALAAPSVAPTAAKAVTPAQGVSADTLRPPRSQAAPPVPQSIPSLVSPTVAESPRRIQPGSQPVPATAATVPAAPVNQGYVPPPPRAIPVPMRESRPTPTLPVPAAGLAAPQVAPRAPQVAQPAAVAPAPYAVPAAPTVAAPGGRATEPPKADKPSTPVLRGPGDSPAK